MSLVIETKKLTMHKDGRGYLFEALRRDDKLFGGEFGQVLISVVYPGVIKGLHLHHKQTDYTACIRGNLKYGIVQEKDGKVEIKTLVIGDTNPLLIKIPPGLWHGYMAVGGEAIILHIMDKTYDPTDVEAKDPNAFGNIW